LPPLLPQNRSDEAILLLKLLTEFYSQECELRNLHGSPDDLE
jgi:hypothetical protein